MHKKRNRYSVVEEGESRLLLPETFASIDLENGVYYKPYQDNKLFKRQLIRVVNIDR
jgi:hypothetical protein